MRKIVLVVLAVLSIGLLVGVSGIAAANERAPIDGGYVTVSEAIFFDCTNMDIHLAKSDSNGTEQWNKTFDSGGCEYGNSVQRTSDGGYIIAGSVRFHIAGAAYIWLIKTDADGNEEWNKTFGDPWSYGILAQQTLDDGYIVLGTKYGSKQEQCFVWVIKIDENGTEEWRKLFGGSSCWEYSWSIEQTSDSGYIIEGIKVGHEWIIKTDKNGTRTTQTSDGDRYTIIWNEKRTDTVEKTYDRSSTYKVSAEPTTDGGHIIVGSISISYPSHYGPNPGVDRDLWLMKTDVNGTKEWEKIFVGGDRPDYGRLVQQTSDGGYIILGAFEHSDIWLIKTDASGDGGKQWEKIFKGINYWKYDWSIEQTSDSEYVVQGCANNFCAWIIVVDTRQGVLSTLSPTPSSTPTPTPESTSLPPPTPTPETPGFKAIFAIAGLLAIAYLIRQRK